jgi:UDP-glucose:(galactosyl)LPS alpha-1,2-glucosyltransferase
MNSKFYHLRTIVFAPNSEQNTVVPIVFTINDFYLSLFKVALFSLSRHASPTTTYDVYIIHELSKAKLISLEKYCSNFPKNFRITCIKINNAEFSKLLNISSCKKLNNNYSYYYRLFLPDILPEYDKVIYSDADVLFLKDIKDMYDIDISDLFAGVVQLNHNSSSTGMLPTDGYHYFTREKNFPNKYFATGNMVMNLSQMRKRSIPQKYQAIIDRFANSFIFPDQDILNFLFFEQVEYIPLNWCVNNTLLFGDTSRYFGTNGHLSNYTKADIQHALTDPYIIHYTGKKPDQKFPSKENRLWLLHLYKSQGCIGIAIYALHLLQSYVLGTTLVSKLLYFSIRLAKRLHLDIRKQSHQIL